MYTFETDKMVVIVGGERDFDVRTTHELHHHTEKRPRACVSPTVVLLTEAVFVCTSVRHHDRPKCDANDAT